MEIQTDTVSGDYFGVIYRGNPIIPILLLCILIGAVWWLWKRRKNAR